SVIIRKIDALEKDKRHYQECYEDALQKIEILESALFILNPQNDNYFLNSAEKIWKKKLDEQRHFILSDSPYKVVAKVLKAYPNQWLPTSEVVLKIFEIENIQFDDILYQPIRQAVSAILRRQAERKIIKCRSAIELRNRESEWLLPLENEW
ncbi:hypothetical protein, partial [[Haemophilus] ducreyi]